MAYTIVKSDGTVLTTIPDGTIDTTSTSLGLPGRSFSGYGQAQDTNFVHLTENFASSTPPPNPLRGQLWYNTTTNTMLVCPADGEANAASWLALTSTSSGATTTFGNISVSGAITASELTVNNEISAGSISANTLTITSNANIANATLSGTTTVSSLNTTSITTGNLATNGNLTGTWTVSGDGVANGIGGPPIGGTALLITGGNLVISGAGNVGIKTDYYMNADGTPFIGGGGYGDGNVAAYLPTYVGNFGGSNTSSFESVFNGRTLNAGGNTITGNIIGRWALTTGSQLTATYADLAERFAADDVYEPGTVVELGGEKEVTIVKDELSEKVFGVVSNTAAYLMNAGSGEDDTHPAIALAGRVSVKVVGIVKKGDRLVSAGNGVARAASSDEITAFNTIGRSLINKDTEDAGVIEAVVMIR
jgi:hypothetical protein